jgi:hypothetical protein
MANYEFVLSLKPTHLFNVFWNGYFTKMYFLLNSCFPDSLYIQHISLPSSDILKTMSFVFWFRATTSKPPQGANIGSSTRNGF